MKLSNTSEYALRILSYMARKPELQYSAKSLIDNLKISDKYLRRIMTDLTKAGFVRSIQGREGGYEFAKPTSEITLSAIVETIEGMQKYTGCALGFEKCSDENPCVMHEIWVPVRVGFLAAFTGKTLNDFDFSVNFKF